MKYSIYILLIGFYSSCQLISNEISSSFIAINKSLEDSIVIMEQLNRPLFEEIDTYADSKQKRELIKKLHQNNILLDTVINLLSKNAKTLIDKEVVNNCLINKGMGQEILNSSRNWRKGLSFLPIKDRLLIEEKYNSIFEISEEKQNNWVDYHFHNMPVMAVLPLLNKIKLLNLQTENIIYQVKSNPK